MTYRCPQHPTGAGLIVVVAIIVVIIMRTTLLYLMIAINEGSKHSIRLTPHIVVFTWIRIFDRFVVPLGPSKLAQRGVLLLNTFEVFIRHSFNCIRSKVLDGLFHTFISLTHTFSTRQTFCFSFFRCRSMGIWKQSSCCIGETLIHL